MRVNKVEKKKRKETTTSVPGVLREEVSERMLRQRAAQTQEQQGAEGRSG